MKRMFYVSEEVAIQLRQNEYPQYDADIRLEDGTAVPSYMEVLEWFRLKGISIDVVSSSFTERIVWDCNAIYTVKDGEFVSLYSGIFDTPLFAIESIIKKILNYEK